MAVYQFLELTQLNETTSTELLCNSDKIDLTKCGANEIKFCLYSFNYE